MNEWASPQTTFTAPRELPPERVLFEIKEIGGPYSEEWISESY